MKRECEKCSDWPEVGKLIPCLSQHCHGLIDATNVAERTAELKQAPCAELAAKARCKSLFVERNRLVFSSCAVMFPAALV
jgi:hypothetical protein